MPGHLWRLTWLEIKIFVREPLGVIGSVGIPVLLFVVLARLVGPAMRDGRQGLPRFASTDLPVFAATMIAVNAVLSLVVIVSIYREGGILKRLRATPLQPATILTAHVIVKLLFTALSLVLMILLGKRYYPADANAPILPFALALLFTTATTASLGFLMASLVPTARFAQPIASLLLYPMLGVSGLFVPVESLPTAAQAFARVVPFTYAVSLLRGVWHGEGWLRHGTDVAVLAIMFVLFTALSARVFRWE